MYAISNAANAEADKIITTTTYTWLFFLNPAKVDASKGDVEKQPCWKIERLEQIEVGNSTVIHRMYPNGRKDYSYVAANYMNYNYIYQR